MESGALAEKLGTGLQNLLDGSVTRTHLHEFQDVLISHWYRYGMPKKRRWTDNELIEAVENSTSYRAVIVKLRLVPAGGNYVQVQNRIRDLGLETAHFSGMQWNKGKTYHTKKRATLEVLLRENSRVQSYKLKNRLFEAGIKQRKCELCDWAQRSVDGRIPLELDHINGNRNDNRLNNLRILCPNCHSLQITHRGKNKKVALRLQ